MTVKELKNIIKNLDEKSKIIAVMFESPHPNAILIIDAKQEKTIILTDDLEKVMLTMEQADKKFDKGVC